MRKLLIVLVVAMLAAAPALADGEYWADWTEPFYHVLPQCGGVEGRSAVSAKGRYACATCAGEMKEYADGLRAVERGGTVVTRITDEYCYSEDWTSTGVFAGVDYVTVSGMDAYAWMSRNFNGQSLLSTAEQLQSGEPAERTIRKPSIYGHYPSSNRGSNMLALSSRYINGCWYQCLRTVDGSKIDPDQLKWRFEELDVSMQNGTLTYGWPYEVVDVPKISIDKGAGEEQLFFKEQSGLSVRVMREMDTYICVIREHDADPDLLEEVGLYICGSRIPVQLNGYMDGTDRVYVTVISDGEFRLIADDAKVSLQHEAWEEDAE